MVSQLLCPAAVAVYVTVVVVTIHTSRLQLLGFAIVMLLTLCKYILSCGHLAPPNDPKTARALLAVRSGGRPTVVALLGDSITHGRASGDYVRRVKDALGDGYLVVNGGVNSELAWNLLQRLDDVIACDPDFVVIMIGTNDWKGIYNAEWGRSSQTNQKLPQMPTPVFYNESLRAILSAVAKRRDGTRREVALCELAPFGEDPDARCQETVKQANLMIAELGREFGASVIPVNARMWEFLRAPSSRKPAPFEIWKKCLVPDILRHYLLWRDWNRIGEAHNFRLMSDGLHLNDIGAEIVADLILKHVLAGR